MTQKQKPDTTKGENKELILSTVKKEKPETTQQLISLIHERTPLHYDEITSLLIELETEDRLHFTRKELPPSPTLKSYILSRQAPWFWATITLAIATTLTIFTIPENAYPTIYLRPVLGTIFILFLPGYTFIKALFPAKVPIQTGSENLDTIERLALSLGMSLALVPSTGLILNYTPWGITLTPVTLSLLALTIVFATTAVIREYWAKTNTA